MKGVVGEADVEEFARNPPCCLDDALEKKIFAAVRGIIHFDDPDLALAVIVKFLRTFNSACARKGSWDSKICEFVFSLTGLNIWDFLFPPCPRFKSNVRRELALKLPYRPPLLSTLIREAWLRVLGICPI